MKKKNTEPLTDRKETVFFLVGRDQKLGTVYWGTRKRWTTEPTRIYTMDSRETAMYVWEGIKYSPKDMKDIVEVHLRQQTSVVAAKLRVPKENPNDHSTKSEK